MSENSFGDLDLPAGLADGDKENSEQKEDAADVADAIEDALTDVLGGDSKPSGGAIAEAINENSISTAIATALPDRISREPGELPLAFGSDASELKEVRKDAKPAAASEATPAQAAAAAPSEAPDEDEDDDEERSAFSVVRALAIGTALAVFALTLIALGFYFGRVGAQKHADAAGVGAAAEGGKVAPAKQAAAKPADSAKAARQPAEESGSGTDSEESGDTDKPRRWKEYTLPTITLTDEAEKMSKEEREREARSLAREARRLLKDDDVSGAKKRIKRGLRTDPGSSTLSQMLAEAYVREEKWPKAKAWAERAIEISPRSSLAYLTLGDAEAGMGRKEKATEAWKRSLELDKDSEAKSRLNN